MRRKALPAYLIYLASLQCAEHVGAAEIQPHLQLAPTDRPHTSVGLDIAASALRLRGHITARHENGSSTVVPQLHSTVVIAPKVQLETQVNFSEWNASSALANETVEVKLRFRSVVPLIDEIEGWAWRGHDGLVRHALRLAAVEHVAASVAGRPIVFRVGATLEQTDPVGSPATRYTGAEATLSGFGRTAADNRVRLHYRAHSTAVEPTTSLLVGRSWRTGDWSRIAVDYTMTDAAQSDSHIALSWQYEF